MASIATSPNGTRRITWLVNQRQSVVRLGRVPLAAAVAAKLHIERLIIASKLYTPIPFDTAVWLSRIDDVIHKRIARTGLCEPRASLESIKLGPAFDAFIESRRKSVKSGTIATWMQCRKHLCNFLGEKQKLTDITPADADDFRRHLRCQYSEAYTAKMTIISKAVMRHAVRRRLIETSPFADVKNGSQRNPERQVFVDRAAIQKVIEAAPDCRWRLIIALARFGGLRVPSELVTLTWGDINWADNRITIHSPKTSHHTGHATRVMPLFPELLPYLREAYEVAKEGETQVIQVARWGSANLRSQFLRIIKRAAVQPWPKLFQNLRSSRATELADEFPSHVGAAWLGHAEKVAEQHYRQVTDDHFAKAIKLLPKLQLGEFGQRITLRR